MTRLRDDLLVQISFFNPFDSLKMGWRFFLRHALLPTRWWCPDHCHIRIAPFVFHIPRRWWSYKGDGALRPCVNCGRKVWRVDGVEGNMMWCDDCSLLERQLRGLFDAPAWWVESIRTTSKRENWFKA